MQTMSFEKIEISFCETHHLQNGKELYATRYQKVLSFHNGIAPVYENNRAFFINTKGEKLFNREFLKAFGFYEGLACVYDRSGFYHILQNGTDAYKNRFAWCGNFVEDACVVMNTKGEYYHISPNGWALYNKKFCYVGDYKYGIAVATLTNGKCIHIDRNGQALYDKEFLELEPFHKGVAVAKDERGYFHIDKNGVELYTKRFRKLEPFYNGRAFGVDRDYQKVVLREDTLKTDTITQPSSEFIKHKLAQKSFDFFSMRILYAILELNILEHLEKNLAIDLPLQSKNLILEWLKTYQIITQNNQLTKKAKVILELKPLICYWQGLPFQASGDIVSSIKEHKESFSKLYGVDFFTYIYTHHKEKDNFSFISRFYTKDYDITPLHFDNQKICELGCGSGRLLDTLKEKYPNIQAVYADKEDLRIHKNGEFVKVDFLKPFKISADIFLMSRILHDWDDAQAITLLKNIAKNMQPNNKLYLLETLRTQDIGVEISFHLLNLLGGRERTLEEFRELFNKSGLEIIELFNTNQLITIIALRKNT